MATPEANSSKSFRTIDLKPGHNELIKPAELIDISGAANLTLSARRMYNMLLANAFGPGMGIPGHEWVISLKELRGAHKSNERLGDSVEALMKTLVVVRMQNGQTRRVQLLGPTDMDEESRSHGTLTYSFDPKLVPLLEESTVFGKLEMSVIRAFSSKYGLALYEAVARRVRLEHVFTEIFPIETFRELLGVPAGKLTTFGNLNQYAIKPALAEINALAPFNVAVIPIKKSRKVMSIRMGWHMKSEPQMKHAFAEVNRSKVGRKARLNGTAEQVAEEQGHLGV